MTEETTSTAELARAVRSMVGARLRQLRLERNLTLEAAANAIDVSISKISRMERGQVPLRRRDLLRLLTLYGVTDPLQQETLISVALGKREPGWWDDQAIPLEESVRWSHEQAATLIRTYNPHLVPDLLRTEEYARAVLRARHHPSPPGPAAETSIRNVLRRQQARQATLWAVIDEPVLWRPIGGDVAMFTRQLDALAGANRRRGVTIQIVPTTSPYLPVCGPFTIYRLPDRQILTLHRYNSDDTTDLRDDEHYGLIFDQLAGVARPRTETASILARIRAHLAEGKPSCQTR